MDSSIASGMFVDVIEQIAQAQECRGNFRDEGLLVQGCGTSELITFSCEGHFESTVQPCKIVNNVNKSYRPLLYSLDLPYLPVNHY